MGKDAGLGARDTLAGSCTGVLILKSSSGCCLVGAIGLAGICVRSMLYCSCMRQ
jgi:hypothetical protein